VEESVCAIAQLDVKIFGSNNPKIYLYPTIKRSSELETTQNKRNKNTKNKSPHPKQ